MTTSLEPSKDITFGGWIGGVAIGAPVYHSHTICNAQGPSPAEGSTEAGGPGASLPDEQQ